MTLARTMRPTRTQTVLAAAAASFMLLTGCGSSASGEEADAGTSEKAAAQSGGDDASQQPDPASVTDIEADPEADAEYDADAFQDEGTATMPQTDTPKGAAMAWLRALEQGDAQTVCGMSGRKAVKSLIEAAAYSGAVSVTAGCEEAVAAWSAFINNHDGFGEIELSDPSDEGDGSVIIEATIESDDETTYLTLEPDADGAWIVEDQGTAY